MGSINGASLFDPNPEIRFSDPPTNSRRRDMLAEIVEEGHSRGFRVIPWFEFGLVVPWEPSSNRPQWLTTEMANEWLTHAKDGSRVTGNSEGWAWLNPYNPQVQDFITNLVVDVVKRYDVDGVQLDDHFGLHVMQGYDNITRQLYGQEHSNANPPDDFNNDIWKKWRAEKITSLLERIFREVKIYRPDQPDQRKCFMSISPGGDQRFSFDHYLADWHRWERSGWIEELIPQFYRPRLSPFETEINKREVVVARDNMPTGIGIATRINGQPVKFSLTQQQIQSTKDQGFAGISLFFYESLWNVRPADETEVERKESLKSSIQNFLIL